MTKNIACTCTATIKSYEKNTKKQKQLQKKIHAITHERVCSYALKLNCVYSYFIIYLSLRVFAWLSLPLPLPSFRHNRQTKHATDSETLFENRNAIRESKEFSRRDIK